METSRTSTSIDDDGGYAVFADGVTGVANGLASVRATSAFARDGDAGNHTSGSLRVAAGDDGYTLDADGGDANAFQLDVTAGGGTTSYTVPWSDRYGFDGIDYRITAGF